MELLLAKSLNDGQLYASQPLVLYDGITFIIGESGLGKTTLLKDIKDNLNNDFTVGYLHQENLLIEDFTIMSNILLFPTITDKEYDIALFNQVINEFKLEKLLTKFPSELSGGQLQRVMLARVIIAKPSILLLDEPFSNQDFANQNKIFNIMREISINTPIICIAHDKNFINEVDQICTIENQQINYKKITKLPTKLQKSKVNFVIKEYLKKTKKRYKIKNIITSIMLILILSLTCLALLPSLNGFLTQQRLINTNDVVSSSISYSTYQEDMKNEVPEAFTYIPGEKETFYFTEQDITNLVNTGYITNIQSQSTLVDIPGLPTTNNSCLTNVTQEQFDQLTLSESYNYASFNGHGCTFYESYGDENLSVIAGSNLPTKQTNEIVVPEWYVIQNGYNPESIIGKDIEIVLTHDDIPMPYVFNVVGVTSETNFYVYDMESYYFANLNINLYDDIENNVDIWLKYNNPKDYPEIVALDQLSGEEIYQTYGIAVDTLAFEVKSDKYSEYYKYINDNFPGVLTQDYFYKSQYQLELLFSQTYKILIIDGIIALIWILISFKLTKTIKKLNQADYLIIGSYFNFLNMKRKIENKRYLTNLFWPVFMLIIISLPLFFITNLSDYIYWMTNLDNLEFYNTIKYDLIANFIAISISWFMIFIILLIDYVLLGRGKYAIRNKK